MSGSASEPPDDKFDAANRRRGDRHMACFPAVLERDGATRNALIRDLSVTGALLVTRARYDVGDQVTLRLQIHGDAVAPKTATGRIVRVTPLGPDEAGLWKRTVAVHFLAPVTELEPEVKALAERQLAVAEGRFEAPAEAPKG